MKKIKILHVLTTTAGGLGQAVLSLVLHLDPERFEVTVAFGPGYPLDRKFAEGGLRVVPIRMKRGLRAINLFGFWDLYRLIRKERFDVVHTHAPIAGFLGRVAAKLVGVEVVIFTLHGGSDLNNRSLLIRFLSRFAQKLLDRCTDYYVAVSDYVQKRWLQNQSAAPERLILIYHGTDLRTLPPHTDLSEKRKMLGLPLEETLIGTVGLLETQKGTEDFIRAIPLVIDAFPACRFVVIGDGPLRSHLEAVAAQVGISQSVTFVGWRTDAAELMGILDLFCLPSLWESFGLVLLEAMAYAKPIVATDVGGIPDVITNGESGLLVPPEDPVSLSKAIVYLLAHPEIAREMGRKGEARLRERFTLERMVQQHESLYLSACRKVYAKGEAVLAKE
jgi:glycosyltransferase involved in cell wall biosynthesis